MKETFSRNNQSQGFSLVETLVVITIMLALASLSAFTLPSMMSSQIMAQTSSDISQTLDDARSYAIANHTYVFVGFEEVNASALPTSPNQTQATATSGGRIAVAIVASKDGSNNLTSTPPYFNSSNLTVISRLKFFTGAHLADFSTLTATTGTMATRASVTAANSLGANSTGGSTSLFTWPLNAASGNAEYNFYANQVIVFDQEGLAGVINNNTYTASGYTSPTSSWIEIGLQVAHGATIPAAPTTLTSGQLASVQLDGVTGANRVLRP
jgi:prepilin-type N-terminal cleavage/methylation domain-containing protein